MHYLVTLLLFGVAAVVLYRTGRALFDTQLPFPANVTTVVNGALFVVIVMKSCAPSWRTSNTPASNSNHF